MPPLELCFEAESFHLTAEEKLEPVETEVVGDGLQQPQDLDQSLISKLIQTAEMPPDAVQDRSLCRLPPLERRCLVAVFVSFIISPSQFYIQLCSRDTSGKLQGMMREMRLLYSHKTVSDRYVLPESSVHPGQLCCVMVLGWWYRAVIHRVINHHEVEVFCTDYGNLKVVQKSDLRLLKWRYLKLPAQAIPCSLAGVQPVQGFQELNPLALYVQPSGQKESLDAE